EISDVVIDLFGRSRVAEEVQLALDQREPRAIRIDRRQVVEELSTHSLVLRSSGFHIPSVCGWSLDGSTLALLQQVHRQTAEGHREQIHGDAAVPLQAQLVDHNLSVKTGTGT